MTVYVIAEVTTSCCGTVGEVLAVAADRTRAYEIAHKLAADRWDVDDKTRRRCDPLDDGNRSIEIEEFEVLT